MQKPVDKKYNCNIYKKTFFKVWGTSNSIVHILLIILYRYVQYR